MVDGAIVLCITSNNKVRSNKKVPQLGIRNMKVGFLASMVDSSLLLQGEGNTNPPI